MFVGFKDLESAFLWIMFSVELAVKIDGSLECESLSRFVRIFRISSFFRAIKSTNGPVRRSHGKRNPINSKMMYKPADRRRKKNEKQPRAEKNLKGEERRD